ncbi:MAG: hypothetical protein ABR576_11800 [Thermoanaerobaculia bacterium]
MPDALDIGAAVLYERWRRAVDLLWRETIRRRQADLQERERIRADRRLRNLRRIVRRALDEYHRIEVERQRSAGSR